MVRSNPNCQNLTSGPGVAPAGTTNVGVAAHVTAAAVGGRSTLATPWSANRAAERLKMEIWLCQKCMPVNWQCSVEVHSGSTPSLEAPLGRSRRMELRSWISELDPWLSPPPRSTRNGVPSEYLWDNFRGEVCMSAVDRTIKDTVLTRSDGVRGTVTAGSCAKLGSPSCTTEPGATMLRDCVGTLECDRQAL